LHSAICTEIGSGKAAPTPGTDVEGEMKGIYMSSEKATKTKEFEREENIKQHDVSTVAKFNSNKAH
jgi:hypothetical protein